MKCSLGQFEKQARRTLPEGDRSETQRTPNAMRAMHALNKQTCFSQACSPPMTSGLPKAVPAVPGASQDTSAMVVSNASGLPWLCQCPRHSHSLIELPSRSFGDDQCLRKAVGGRSENSEFLKTLARYFQSPIDRSETDSTCVPCHVLAVIKSPQTPIRQANKH